MGDGPPPLLPEKKPLVTLTGAVGLLLIAIGAALVSWLFSGTAELTAPKQFLVAAAGAVVATLGIGFSLVAEKRSGAQRTFFVIGLVLGAGTLVLAVQAMRDPAAEFYAVAARGVQVSKQRKVDVVKQVGGPIPQVEGSLTRDLVEPFYRSWIEEKMQRGYDEHGSHDPKWDSAAREFPAGVLVSVLGLRGAPREEQIDAWTKTLRSTGCDDPLVLATLAEREPDATARETLYRKATEGLKERGYSPGLLFLTQAKVWAQLGRKRSGETGSVATAAFGALKDEWAALPLNERDYWMWNYFLTNGAPNQLFEAKGDALLAVVEPLTTIEPWFKHRLRGEWEIKEAWAARSDKTADEVSSAGWTGFKKHLDEARKELTESWKLHPQHPAAAQLMITVAMGQSDNPAGEMRQWFDRAVSARIDFIPAYKSLLWGLRPRWYGSQPAMLAFGKACADTKRFDTAAPWEYFVATRDLASEWDEPDAFYREAAPYDELRELCLTYASSPKAPESPSFYLSHLAFLAAACGHRTHALDALSRLNFQLVPKVMDEWKADETWAGKYLIRSGAQAALVKAAESAEQLGEFSRAIENLQKVAEAGADVASQAYLKSRIAALERLQPIEKASWEPYLPPVGGGDEWKKAGWIGVRGRWSQPDAQTLELAGDRTTETLVHSDLPPGEIYEVRGEIEHLTPGAKVSSAAITLGWPEDTRDVWLTVRFRRSQERGNSVVFAHGMGSDRVFPAPNSSGPIQFAVRVVEHHITVVMNGKAVMDTDFRPPGDVSGQPPVVGFGIPKSEQPVTVRFHNVEWRRMGGWKPKVEK